MNFKIRFVLIFALLLFFVLYFSNIFSVPASKIAIPSIILNGNVGGTGNQLFRYAFAFSLATQYKIPLYISRLTSRKFTSAKREFSLNCFQLNQTKFKYLPIKSIESISSSSRFHLNEVHWWEQKIPNNKILVLEDYFESEIFFEANKQDILAQFELNQGVVGLSSLNQSPIFQDIESSESVAVHFRIGDFNAKGINNRVLPTSFQVRAMQRMKSILNYNAKIRFFVFSDDIQWVRSRVAFKDNVTFVSATTRSTGANTSSLFTSIQEFYLMSKCKHNIVPNSTFSWWAAYLNKNPAKVVIAACPKNKPSYYERYNDFDARYLKKLLGSKYAYPKDWLTINPYERF